MPILTRWFLKTSLVHLVAALVVGVLLAAGSIGALPAVPAGIGPLYFHLFMVGWVAQLIFGVVYWLFPKYSKEEPRGRVWLGWATYGLLNVGLLLRVVGEPANAARPGEVWGWLLAVSAGLQWLAGLAFVINTWPRVHGGPRRRKKEE
jgi:hypothetical protein